MRFSVLKATIFYLAITINFAQAQNKQSALHAKKSVLKLIDANLAHAATQYKFLQSITPLNEFPKTFENNKSNTSSAKYWTSGFYPGTLVYLFNATDDKTFLAASESKLPYLEEQKNNKKTHDLGFIMYNSFGNAYRIQKKEAYKDVLITSAKSLASRYSPIVKSIQSWDRIKSLDGSVYWDFPVIIDNMMNLELLFFASEASGDDSFRKIAIQHAETAMKNHVRPDFSSYHVVAYDPKTGAVNSKETYQGFAHNSTWARGQGWGIYGFTTVYRKTKDERFLKTAVGMADYFLNHKNLPKDGIPYWDFNAGQKDFPSSFNYDAPKYPVIPRDASAGALIASALIELSQYVDHKKGKKYLKAAEKMIKSLSSSAYRAEVGENGGFLLMHSVSNLTKNREVDVPLAYADYYYVEAMLRYKNLAK